LQKKLTRQLKIDLAGLGIMLKIIFEGEENKCDGKDILVYINNYHHKSDA
jgi:hypothetical protein